MFCDYGKFRNIYGPKNMLYSSMGVHPIVWTECTYSILKIPLWCLGSKALGSEGLSYISLSPPNLKFYDMLTTKTTGRVHDYDNERKNDVVEGFKKKFENSRVFLDKFISGLNPEGAQLSLPTVPVELNVRSDQLAGISSGFSGIGEKLKSFWDSVWNFMDWSDPDIANLDLLIFVLFITTLQYKSRALTAMFGFFLGVRLMYSVITSRDDWVDYVKAYSDHMSGSDIDMEEIPQPQGALDVLPPCTELMLTSLSGVLGACPKEPFVRALVEMTKVNDNQRNNVMAVLMMMSRRVSQALEKMCGSSELSRFFHVDEFDDRAVSDYVDRVNKFLASVMAVSAGNKTEMLNMYSSLDMEGKKFLANLTKGSFDYKSVEHVLLLLSRFKSEKVGESFTVSGDRQEPVTIMFRGPPGVGKTVASHAIVDVLLEQLVDPSFRSDLEEQPHMFKFNKGLDKFFDTYDQNTIVTMIDDFCSARDTSASVDTHGQLLIDMCNSNPMALKMAKLEDKNKVYFRSKLITLTSNLTDFNLLQSVMDPKAVERRINIQVDVKISPEYSDSKGVLDESKLPFLLGPDGKPTRGTIFPDDFWEFSVKTRNANNVSDSQRMCFEDLCLHILDEVHKREVQYMSNTTMNKLRRDRLRSNLSARIPNRPLSPESGYSTTDSSSGSSRGSYLIDQEEDFIFDFCSSFASLPKEDQKAFLKRFFSFCHYNLPSKGQTKPYFDLGLKGIAACMWRNDVKYHSFRNMELSTFTVMIENVIRREVSQGVDYATGKKPANSFLKTIVDGLKSCVSRISSYIFKNWYIIGIVGIFLVPLCILCRKIYSYFFGYEEVKIDDPDRYRYLAPDHLAQRKSEEPENVYMSDIFAEVGDEVRKTTEGADVVPKKDFVQAVLRIAARDPDALLVNDVGYCPVKASTLSGGMKTFIKIQPLNPESYSFEGVTIERVPKLLGGDLGERNSTTDIISKCLNSYIFNVFVAIKDDKGEIDFIRLGIAHNVHSNVFLMNFHFVCQLASRASFGNYRGGQIFLTTSTKSIVYRIPLETFIHSFTSCQELEERDLCFVVIKQAQVQSAGSLRYFVSETDLSRLGAYGTIPATVIGTSVESPLSNNLIIKKQVVGMRKMDGPQMVSENWQTGKKKKGMYLVHHMLMYRGSMFKSGDCGSLAYLDVPSEGNRMIFGIHSAGLDGNGFCVTVTQGLILQAMKDCKVFQPDTYSDEVIPDIGPMYPLEAQGCMKPVCKINSELAPMSNTSSELTKSVLYNKLPSSIPKSNRTPARLKPFFHEGALIDPKDAILASYGHQPPVFVDTILARAVESYEEVITHNMKMPLENRIILGLYEVLQSFGSVRGIDPSTSAGWPDNIPLGKNWKKLLFTPDGLVPKDSDEFRAFEKEVLAVLKMILNGVRPFCPYTGNKKDEKLSREKALLGRTRFVAGVWFIILCLFRMHFGAFMDNFMEANMDVGSAIGVNPFSLQWDVLARKLSRFDTKREDTSIGAGDYKAFDGHQQPGVMQEVLNIINRWYGNDVEGNRIRSRLWAEITNPKVFFEGELYEWFSSMPSGNPMTAIVNTMTNQIYFRMSWQFAGLDWKVFNANVYVIVIGDDNVFCVSIEYRPYFNELLLPDLMDMCGMIYTTELKAAATVPFRKLTEVEFMKRSFRFDRSLGRWVAPLREESIIETLYWSKKGSMKNQITVDNASNALREYSLHGERKFSEFRDTVIPVVKKLLPDHIPNYPFLQSYEIALEEVLKLDRSFYF